MEIGKLPAETLSRLLAKASSAEGVLIGPTYGEDAAAVVFGGRILVAASDPITFTTDRIGYYAVSVNANDIAAHGARPRWFLATILLPEGASESDAENVFDQINRSCERIGVGLIGGHTEITRAVDRIVVCGCMFGEVDEGGLVYTAGARVGDALVLAGGIAIEGTSILAREAEGELVAKGVPPEVIKSGRQLLDNPGICVLDYAMAAVEAGGVTSMHDPTEGGLATALRELASASKRGLRISRDAIHILPECREICDALGLDPLGLIASGSLLIACSPDRVGEVVSRLQAANVPASVIGEVVEAKHGLTFDDGSDLPAFSRDEIARYLDR